MLVVYVSQRSCNVLVRVTRRPVAVNVHVSMLGPRELHDAIRGTYLPAVTLCKHPPKSKCGPCTNTCTLRYLRYLSLAPLGTYTCRVRVSWVWLTSWQLGNIYC